MEYRIIKRGFDCAIALPLFIITSPLVGMILLFLRTVTTEFPVFIQPRVGYQEQVFLLYKIRTIYSEELYTNTPWIKHFCRWLRQYSLDEIPQLWNVLKGDMSLIGPRPLLVEYLPLYNEKQRKRHLVKPGLSGWAQMQGRNDLSWTKRFALDAWYVEHQSFNLDLKILYYTIRHLFRPQGVRPEGLSVLEKFSGNDSNP